MTQHWRTSCPEKWKLQWKTLRTSFQVHVRALHSTWQHSGLFSRRSCPLLVACSRMAISVTLWRDVSASITTATVYSFAGRLIPPSAPMTQQAQLKGQSVLQHKPCTQISLTHTTFSPVHTVPPCHQQVTGLIHPRLPLPKDFQPFVQPSLGLHSFSELGSSCSSTCPAAKWLHCN